MEKFPERVYTVDEVKKARELLKQGYKHALTVEGSTGFKTKVQEALNMVKTAGYYEFLRTYIRCVVEIDGFTQLRESEASIWANKYAVEDGVDAASLFIQKAYQMKQYVEGEVYYGGSAEKDAIEKRIEFLEDLKDSTGSSDVKERCKLLLQNWADSVYL